MAHPTISPQAEVIGTVKGPGKRATSMSSLPLTPVRSRLASLSITPPQARGRRTARKFLAKYPNGG